MTVTYGWLTLTKQNKIIKITFQTDKGLKAKFIEQLKQNQKHSNKSSDSIVNSISPIKECRTFSARKTNGLIWDSKNK